jgi:acetyl esterase
MTLSQESSRTTAGPRRSTGADVVAWVAQKTAPITARYGRDLCLSGMDLPEPEVHEVETRHGWVRVHEYRPFDPIGSYVHLHGGAFMMRYPMMDDWFCRIVAAEVGAVVLNVDYDVAPQARYPVAQEQAHDVLAWASTFREGPVAVGGFSAGGNLAASAALQARDLRSCRPVLQLLGVPTLIQLDDPAARSTVLKNPIVPPWLMRMARATYFNDHSRRAESYASPLLEASLKGLAPALIVTAELDRLRGEGEAYVARLASAGVPVRHLLVEDADHYFLEGGRQSARRTIDVMVRALCAAFRT